MSQENVDIVRRGYEAFDRGDVERVLAGMSEEVVTYWGPPLNNTFHGKDGYLQVVADWGEGFEAWSVTPQEFIEIGDHVVVRVVQTARGEQSGTPVTGSFLFFHTVRVRKIVRRSPFM